MELRFKKNDKVIVSPNGEIGYVVEPNAWDDFAMETAEIDISTRTMQKLLLEMREEILNHPNFPQDLKFLYTLEA